AAGIRQLADQVAPKALEQSQVQQLWVDANRAAHKQLLLIVEDKKNGVIKTANGVVTLDLSALVKAIAKQIGVGEDLANKVPKDAAHLTILKSDQLATAQDIVKILRGLAIVLPILALLLFALAIYLAKGRRRETLRAVGIDLILVGILVYVVRGVAGHAVTDALAQTASSKPAVDEAWTIATDLLSD